MIILGVVLYGLRPGRVVNRDLSGLIRVDMVCSACGEDEKTAEHLMMFCKGLEEDGAEFFKALGQLGFRDATLHSSTIAWIDVAVPFRSGGG